MDSSKPSLPIPLHLPEFTQVRVHWIGDAIQPSHPLPPSSPFASIFPSIKVFSNESAIGMPCLILSTYSYFPDGTVVKNLPANAREKVGVSGSGRSPGEGNDNPLQFSCLENPMDRGAWWAAVHEVANSQTRLSTHTQFYTKKGIYCSSEIQIEQAVLCFIWQMNQPRAKWGIEDW